MGWGCGTGSSSMRWGGWSGKLSGEDDGMGVWNRFINFEGGEGGMANQAAKRWRWGCGTSS